MTFRWLSAWRAFVSLHSDSDIKDLALAEGLRAAVGIAIPVAIGLLADHLVWGNLCAFATLWILLCDVGGAYRQKAINLAASSLAIIGAFIFGGWMIGSVTNYIIGVFLWVSSAALIGVAGNAAAQAGLVSSTIVVTSVVLFVPSEFLVRLLLCLIGCIWVRWIWWDTQWAVCSQCALPAPIPIGCAAWCLKHRLGSKITGFTCRLNHTQSGLRRQCRCQQRAITTGCRTATT